jgi:hypothetical protein
LSANHDPALDHAGRYGEFLTEAIDQLKGEQTADRLPAPTLASSAPAAKPAINKFSELADKIARTRKALDARADKLIARVDAIGTKGNAAFDQHESALDEHERGIDSLDEALSGLIGHNRPPE